MSGSSSGPLNSVSFSTHLELLSSFTLIIVAATCKAKPGVPPGPLKELTVCIARTGDINKIRIEIGVVGVVNAHGAIAHTSCNSGHFRIGLSESVLDGLGADGSKGEGHGFVEHLLF